MNRGKAAGKRRRKSDIYVPIILLMPAFLLVVGVIIYPICYAVGLSFQYYKLTDYVNRQFIGLENSITLMPWVTPGVVIALMWVWIYNGNFGVLNKCLTSLGIISKNVPWLGSSRTALYSQIVTMIWQGIPFFAIMVLAALQTISVDLYEAADISGANSWQKFVYITLPELMPTIITTCMLRIIWVFNNVEVLYLMTGGGPGHSSMTVSLVAYIKAQKSLDFGQGSTIAIYGTLFMILFMTIYLKLTRRGDEDEKD